MSDMDLDNLSDEAKAPERSASLTLDQIRDGGQALVMVCQTRLNDCAAAIGEGRFHDALGHVQEAAQKLSALAQAECMLGSLAESFIIRAEAMEEGMVLRGHGTVTDIRREEKPVAGSDPCIHIHLTFEGDQPDLELHADSEVVIVRGED